MFKFLLSIFLLVLFQIPVHAQSGIIAGAIRWDAWYGITPGGSAISAQQSLGPTIWQFRAPKHCSVISTISVECVGTQAVMDAEIAQAAAGGLKYWAFVQEAPTSDLTIAWNLYQSSTTKGNINWTWISSPGSLGSTGNFTTQMNLYASQMQQSNFEKITVAGVANRPIFYILWDSTSFASNWSSNFSNVAAAITYLRGKVTAAGLGTPYIIIMSGTPATAASVVTGIGADAITSYSLPATVAFKGTAASLISQAATFWTRETSTGIPMVPIAQTGADTRPRLIHTPNFNVASGARPSLGASKYYVASTDAEFAGEVTAAVAYINANPASAVSKLLLIYAWNENDEGGGGLNATIGDPTGIRLSTIASIIR